MNLNANTLARYGGSANMLDDGAPKKTDTPLLKSIIRHDFDARHFSRYSINFIQKMPRYDEHIPQCHSYRCTLA